MSNEIALVRLRVLVGKRLCLTRRSLDVRQFHFGDLTIDGQERWGEWALHVACPWRVDGPTGLIAGSSDIHHPPSWGRDERSNGTVSDRVSLQDEALASWMKGEIDPPSEVTNGNDVLTVENVWVDKRMTTTVTLADRSTITVMPAGVRDEAWRFFQPDGEERHLVIVGDLIETDE